MHAEALGSDGCSAWNPGVRSGIPGAFRRLETIRRPEYVQTTADEVEELSRLTGLAPEELTAYRPGRLALHELIVRVTADIAVAEGDSEEVFGLNFRRTVLTILNDYIAPHQATIDRAHGELHARVDAMVRQILAQTLYAPRTPTVRRKFPFGLFSKPKTRDDESVQDIEHRALFGYKEAGLRADDPLLRSIHKSLYRVLGSLATTQGHIGSNLDLVASLVTRHVCNSYGSQRVGQLLDPLVEAAISERGYARTCNRGTSILISLKGASAAGKSSLRPMLKQVMREKGVESDGYITISPDIWRRLLLDYDSLGPATKYAGHLTSREIMVVDGKLDRYIRAKANREHAIPHILVDRFRFDSFSSDRVPVVLQNTYAKYVDTMHMYFVVTPPEETVERGWQRALERGRYKSVEDFLGHSVEAYTGMPLILFKWLKSPRPEFRYVFVDNRVAKGTFPLTIAFGDRSGMTIYDPLALIDIERFQKINIHATSREEVYPSAQATAVAGNAGFLKALIEQIPVVDFVDRATDRTYLRARNRVFERVDEPTLSRVLQGAEMRAMMNEVAPHLVNSMT